MRLRDGVCQIWTALDDHSRYAVGLAACPDQRGETVQARLTEAFRRYGLPDRILCDNGSPGATTPGIPTPGSPSGSRLSVAVSHGRPLHPQTQGKDERFHGTRVSDLLRRSDLLDRPVAMQACFPHDEPRRRILAPWLSQQNRLLQAPCSRRSSTFPGGEAGARLRAGRFR